MLKMLTGIAKKISDMFTGETNVHFKVKSDDDEFSVRAKTKGGLKSTLIKIAIVLIAYVLSSC
jgi:hypothetical protein